MKCFRMQIILTGAVLCGNRNSPSQLGHNRLPRSIILYPNDICGNKIVGKYYDDLRVSQLCLRRNDLDDLWFPGAIRTSLWVSMAILFSARQLHTWSWQSRLSV